MSRDALCTLLALCSAPLLAWRAVSRAVSGARGLNSQVPKCHKAADGVFECARWGIGARHACCAVRSRCAQWLALRTYGGPFRSAASCASWARAGLCVCRSRAAGPCRAAGRRAQSPAAHPTPTRSTARSCSTPSCARTRASRASPRTRPGAAQARRVPRARKYKRDRGGLQFRFARRSNEALHQSICPFCSTGGRLPSPGREWGTAVPWASRIASPRSA